MVTGNDHQRIFISHASEDKDVAMWIANVLDEAGHTTIIQEFDFRPGQSFLEQMRMSLDKSDRVMALYSKAYFNKPFPMKELYSVLANDSLGRSRVLIPIRIEACDIPMLFSDLIYVDIAGHDEGFIRQALLDSIADERIRRHVDFPPRLTESSQPAGPGEVKVEDGSAGIRQEDAVRTKGIKRATARFYRWVSIATAIACAGIWLVPRLPRTDQPEVSVLSELHRGQIETAKSMITLGLFVALCLLTVLFFAMSRGMRSDRKRFLQYLHWPVLVVALLFVSMFSAFLAWQTIGWMFAKHFFDITHPQFAWRTGMQMICLLLAVFLSTVIAAKLLLDE